MIINQILQNIATTAVVISMIAALAVGFFGYKLKRVFAAICGFAIGSVLGAIVTAIVCPKVEYFLTILLVVALITGIIGAIVSFKFYKVGVFIYMFSTTFTMVYSLLDTIIAKSALPAGDDVSLLTANITSGNFSNINWGIVIASFAVSIIIGVITVIYIRNIMIVVTAISGGINFSTGLLVNIIKFNNLFVILLVAAAVAVLGMTVQFRTTKKHY